MAEHDDMDLTMDTLDEQIEALSQVALNEPAASLLDMPDARLIQDLRNIHASAAQADGDALEHVFARLRAYKEQRSSAGTLSPVSRQPSQKTQRKGLQKMHSSSSSPKNESRSILRPLLNVLAATFLVGLIGTTLGTLYLWHQANQGTRPATPAKTATSVPTVTPSLYYSVTDALSQIDPQTGKALWKKSFPFRSLIQFNVAHDFRIWTTSDDTVFVPYKDSPDHVTKLYALDAQTGNVRWDYTPKDLIISTVISAHGMVYFCTAPSGNDGPGNATVVALDMKSGKSLWKYPLSQPLFVGLPSPHGDALVVADGRLYVNVQTGIVALNAQHGTLVWKTPQQGASSITYDSLAVTHGQVYVMVHNDGRQYVQTFDAQQGTSPRASQALGGDLAGDLVVVDGIVYVITNANLSPTGPYEYTLSAVDPASGTRLWSYKGSGWGVQLQVANGRVIIAYNNTNSQGENTDGLKALDIHTHAGIWQRQLHQGMQQTIAFTLLDGRVYTVSDDGTMSVLALADGTLLWQKNLLS